MTHRHHHSPHNVALNEQFEAKHIHQKTFKPLYWSLFGAGGMIAALVLPTLIVLLSLFLPFALLGDPITLYARLHPWVSYKIIFISLAGTLFLILWHCVHRFYYCLHDCQIHVGNKTRFVLYAIAILALAITLLSFVF